MERLAFALMLSLGLGLSAYSLACALGYAPWLTLSVAFGPYAIDDAGMYLQLLVSGFALSLCFFLPANARMMRLETSHRNFHMGMRDVARAYAAAHKADREGVFTLSSEFDSVRERMAFLRDHPDLSDLEPSVLELAAQMSHVSRELAHVYSDRNVARARDFLLQRQQELDVFNSKIDDAKAVANDMRHWLNRLDTDEAVARAQLERVSAQMTELMAAIDARKDGADKGFTARDDQPAEDRVIDLPQQRAAE
ncbi:DNA repair protein [Thalassococcus arenae]|nr:DNA repair protein [Thalassococcus arenae]